jgi:hypothetical protein
MVGRELNTDSRFALDHHHVPVILSIDRAVEHTSPENAFSRKVCGVEHHNLVIDAHVVILGA